MLGAIIGDIVGSPFEFDHNNIKTKIFPMFSNRSYVTDDTIMSLAVAEGIINAWNNENYKDELIKSMQKLGIMYPNAGYGARFNNWIYEKEPKPYNSFGNGSAMRVSSVAWLFNSLDDVLKYARISAEVTHNHPEGIKGAQATAAAIFFARQGADKKIIRNYISDNFEYNLNRTCDEIRPYYHHVESCQETVPEAIIAFLEGNDFEDCIRNAVSLGGDSDTLTAITGSIAEAYYGIPEEIIKQALFYLDDEQRKILKRYREFLSSIRKHRIELWNNLKITLPFFSAKCNTTWHTPPKSEEGVFYFAHPSYGKEVILLEEIAQSQEFTVVSYHEIIELFGYGNNFENNPEIIRNINSPFILRAMLTYIVRHERFCDGAIATCIKNGVIYEIINRLGECFTTKNI